MMSILPTAGDLLKQAKLIHTAVDLLKQGKLIAFPTDTLYGLGADPKNDQAIKKVFALKGRDYKQALPVLLPRIADLSQWIDQASLDNAGLTTKLYDLLENFWPGPLTVVVKKAKKVSDLLTANQDTIALRVPDHPVSLELLKVFNSGIIGTSANRSGGPELTCVAEILETFGQELFIVDGGVAPIGVRSTIVAVIDGFKVLREGAISLEKLHKYF